MKKIKLWAKGHPDRTCHKMQTAIGDPKKVFFLPSELGRVVCL